jgi:RNA polymerase sigma-70 factor (ECF subfamily)
MHPAEDAYRRSRTQIYRFLLQRTGDHHDAEDLTQRVFVDALHALNSADTVPDSVLHWLYTVAQRRMVDEYRRRARASDPIPLPEPNPRYGAEVTSSIAAALEQLTPDQHTVVVLRLLRGLTFPEIADHLGVTEDACKMRFSRALNVVRDELRTAGLDDVPL